MISLQKFQVRIFGQACRSALEDGFRQEEVVRAQGQEAPLQSKGQQPENFARNESGKRFKTAFGCHA